MSEVWTAEDLELGRRVALKLLGRDADPARFEREAHAVASLAHPNICRLYDYGEEGGRPFMVLEYLGGGTLEDRLLPGEPYPDDEAERIARELAAGLAHAHTRDLVHRDLKPANVLFDDEGTAKIADFGIARLGGSGTLTETGTLLGTYAAFSVTSLTASGTTATATTSAPHGFATGNVVTIVGAVPNLFNGPYSITVPTEVVEWRSDRGPNVGGVSSFGFCGTNAHVVVEAAEARAVVATPDRECTPALLPLSAATPDALRALAGRYACRSPTLMPRK